MEEFKEILAGDSLAFDQLYRQYCPIVYKMREKYYLRGFDLDDWVQEGRIIFYKSIERYDVQQKTTIDATSVSLDQKVDSQGESFFNDIGVNTDDVLDQMIIRENLEELPITLSPFERITFQEYMSGKDIEEIAKAKQVKEDTIRSAYDRAKKKIKSLIYD